MNMKVYYHDGEIDIYEGVPFEVFDLEGLVSPTLNALILENSSFNKQVCILLDRVKKIEFDEVDE
jgi:hypothetical protein